MKTLSVFIGLIFVCISASVYADTWLKFPETLLQTDPDRGVSETYVDDSKTTRVSYNGLAVIFIKVDVTFRKSFSGVPAGSKMQISQEYLIHCASGTADLTVHHIFLNNKDVSNSKEFSVGQLLYIADDPTNKASAEIFHYACGKNN